MSTLMPRRSPFLHLLLTLGFMVPSGCTKDDKSATPTIEFGAIGSLSKSSGQGSFRFGATSSATQIEENNTHTDWYHWTLPEADGGMGKSPFVQEGVRGVAHALDDVALLTEMNLEAYRFGIEWARVEPARDIIDEEALSHYGALLTALVTAGIRPMVTLHHFSNPIWTNDFRTPCQPGDAPTDTNLCGWAHPSGADAIIEELAEHAALMAERYGDRVDEWCTINEPVNYIFASYGAGEFPPGDAYMLEDFDVLMNVFRNFMRAHVAIYDAIKTHDTVDADGDGLAADIGLGLSVIDWQASYDNKPSDHPSDVAARDRVWYAYHHLFPDAIMEGGFDADLDQVREESHPNWTGKLDWLGIQYYVRAGVTGTPALLPVFDATICVEGIDFGSCLPPLEETHVIPSVGYEYYEPGMYTILKDMSARYPSLPLVITETGIATQVGQRRSEHIVRTLEQMNRAMEEGVDVRGYYHWSLTDNFEWLHGFGPTFGLYQVNLDTYERTPTEGAVLLGEVAASRQVTAAQRATYGGTGPMTPEPTDGAN